ncbi:unnamed protein product [Sympodiomycopsis kandeliae]
MSDSTLPTTTSSGATVADVAKDESLKEVAVPEVSESVSSGKGKGKAVEANEDDDDIDNEDDSDDDEDDDDDEEDEEEDDDKIDADEVDPTLISSYGIGNRPSRRAASRPIDYSSEEAQRKAGFTAGGGSNEEDDDDKEFKGDVSMDG